MNKKYFSFIVYYLLLFSGYSQNSSIVKPSKEETQQWIKEKIGLYSYKSDEGTIKNDYIISYEDAYIWIKNINWDNMTGTTVLYTRIQITDIEKHIISRVFI